MGRCSSSWQTCVARFRWRATGSGEPLRCIRVRCRLFPPARSTNVPPVGDGLRQATPASSSQRSSSQFSSSEPVSLREQPAGGSGRRAVAVMPTGLLPASASLPVAQRMAVAKSAADAATSTRRKISPRMMAMRWRRDRPFWVFHAPLTGVAVTRTAQRSDACAPVDSCRAGYLQRSRYVLSAQELTCNTAITFQNLKVNASMGKDSK